MQEAVFKTENEEKKRIFNVAMALMDDIGYEKMTIRRICHDAEISTGKFYHYFGSKQQLLSFFYTQADDRYESECHATLIGKPIREQILLFYTWYGTYLDSFGVEFVTNFFSNNNPAMNTHIYNNPVILITDNLITEAIQMGYTLPKGQTVREISNDICVIVKGVIFEWCVRHGEFSISEYIQRLLDKCLDGFF